VACLLVLARKHLRFYHKKEAGKDCDTNTKVKAQIVLPPFKFVET